MESISVCELRHAERPDRRPKPQLFSRSVGESWRKGLVGFSGPPRQQQKLSVTFLLRAHCLKDSFLSPLRARRQGRAEQRGAGKEEKPQI